MSFETLIMGASDLEKMSALAIVGIVILHGTIRYGILESLFIYFLSKNTRAIRNRVYQFKANKEQVHREISSGVKTLILDAFLLAALLKSGIVKSEPGHILITYALTFVWFEVWFYAMHRVLHNKRFYFIHRHHHESRVVGSLTAHSFSLLERLLTLGGGILPIAVLSNFMPLSTLGVGIYILTSQILTIYIHMNVEFIPPAWAKIPGLNWFNAPTHHAMHHARFNGHFGLYTGILDRMFASEFEDYHALQNLAYNGKGLKSFHERIKAPVPEVDLSKPGVAA